MIPELNPPNTVEMGGEQLQNPLGALVRGNVYTALKVSAPATDAVKQASGPRWRDVMGPGLITGASDDDPSGIATYSQAGAQFGYGVGWTLLLTYPLMCAIQLISAQVGRVTGRGLAGNLRRHYPTWVLYPLVGLLVIANTINLGADLGAMAAALHLLIAGPVLLYIAAFAIVTVVAEVFMTYARYASVLRWLTLSLFAYVGTVFVVGVPWAIVAKSLVLPHFSLDGKYLTVIVAVFGTTISPYLFFWQAGEEVENEKEDATAKPLIRAPEQALVQMARMQLDTVVGMGLLQHHRTLHHAHDRGDAERPWRHQHSDLISGRRSAAADRRSVCIHGLRARHHRNGTACGSGAGRERGLRCRARPWDGGWGCRSAPATRAPSMA